MVKRCVFSSKWVVSLAVFITLLGCSSEQSPREIYREGRSYYDEGDFAKAASFYRLAAEIGRAHV